MRNKIKKISIILIDSKYKLNTKVDRTKDNQIV